ncbi:amidohydrolase [Paenibacillus bovis]|uniref:5-methylthioadenosine/S-adenosylhomocysteine deaminase n=1 Tax=Paenibacillus bovis TaxID=1616788 RepID=A0A172ZHR7_9BACL|nr:amidohydrolase [Paenibacillus bovis]ANF96837.1 N-ethylammeline chlorohydrolase [Paenibacillus bovis]
MSIQIRNATIVTMCSAYPEPFQGDVILKGDRIEAIIPATSTEYNSPYPAAPEAEIEVQVIDGTGMAVMPGLINAHQHTPMNLLKGFSDDLKLMDWLEQKMFPAEARMTAEDIYWGSKLSMAEMIRSGTTTFADMYIHMDEIANAVTETGMRASLTRGLVFGDDRSNERIREAIDLVERWQGGADGRITTMFGPHAPYTCPPEKLREVITLAEQYERPIHIHLAETTEEVSIIREKYGQTPTEYLYQLGLFEHLHVMLAHGVHLNQRDIGYLRGMRGGVVHNPVSNLKLGCGIAPIVALQLQGITVGLGTDGAGSATTLDMFAEIKAAAWLQKLDYGDPTRMSAYDTLQLATTGSARLLGLDHEVGTLEAGKKADLILINLNQPHLQPVHHLYSILAYAAVGGDVHTTIVNGQVLMHNRQLLTMDEPTVLHEAHTRAKRIVEGI